MTPIQACFEFIVLEIRDWFVWTTNVQLFGISFLGYFVGFAIVGIVIDYIFG